MELDLNIPGLKVDSFDFSLPDCQYVIYKTFLCEISIATDILGTQICYNGRFFGKSNFRDIYDAISYLRDNKESAIKYFRREYIRHFKYYFTIRHLQHIYWKIRHYFDPDFYL